MDTPPVPKPRSAFLPQNDPIKRPVPLPRTKIATNDRVSASDIFRSISSVSKQLTEDVAMKVSSSAKSANEKLEKSIQDGSKFAKGTLEKTITTSRAVRDSVTKSVIESTRTAGMKLRRPKKPETLDEIDSQRCVSMPVVDVSLFDNIQFHSPLLEQKRYRTEPDNALNLNSQDLPSLNLNASHFDDMSLFSANSDSNADTVSNFSYDSRESDQNNSINFESEQLTYDTPKHSRANSIISSKSTPEVPERRKKRESNIEFMRQNSMYENWILPNSNNSNSQSKTPMSTSNQSSRPSKSTIFEFDPLNSSKSTPKYDGVSNELILLESFLIGDTYGSIVTTDTADDTFDFRDSEYFNPPTPPERSDSLFPENETKTDTPSAGDKDKNSNWFVPNESETKSEEIKGTNTHSVMQKFSSMLKLDNVLHKSVKPVVSKVDAVERPAVNSLPVQFYSGTMTKVMSGGVEELFKNAQSRFCVLSDQKLMCYTDPTNSVLKESYTLDSINSLQVVLPLSSSTTSNSYMLELSVAGTRSTPRKVLFSCASASERRNWAQKIVEHLAGEFPTKYTAEFTRCGWCYLKVRKQNHKLVGAGAASEAAEKAKLTKYGGLGTEYDFVPFGVETLGPWGPSALNKEISKRLVDVTGERRAGSFLASLAIQRARGGGEGGRGRHHVHVYVLQQQVVARAARGADIST
ncbi:hypothetical protein MSG28_001186 [Choristoneura fumiferana]|uniref:Uncharacterized protein n=1 Tax=Choristoneura fumiferana TaxID=7141 RepID=A0ACC0K3U2_CHOFU|nr:hypothetical protein MSG28_001186 [Choristoneura fumiferana]